MMSGSRHLPTYFIEDDGNGDLEDEDEIICTHVHSVESSPVPPSSSSQENKGLGARDAAIAAGVAGTAGIAAPVAGTALLTGVGFTSSGVAAGSIAAGLQAGIGNVAAGSLFAAAQSVGATGGFALLGPVGIGAAAVGGLGYLGIKAVRNWRRRTNSNEEKSKEKQTENTRNNNQGNATDVRPMCLDCRRKLMLRITRNFFRHRM